MPAPRRRFVGVPAERQALGKAKRKGEVREYLEELASTQDPSRAAERWFYSDWLKSGWFVKASAKRQTAAASTPADAAAPPAPDGQQPEETGYTDTQPRFWSLDNPIVATGAALGSMVLLAALTH